MTADVVSTIRNGLHQYPLTIADLKKSPQMHGTDDDYVALFQIYQKIVTIFDESTKIVVHK